MEPNRSVSPVFSYRQDVRDGKMSSAHQPITHSEYPLLRLIFDYGIRTLCFCDRVETLWTIGELEQMPWVQFLFALVYRSIFVILFVLDLFIAIRWVTTLNRILYAQKGAETLKCWRNTSHRFQIIFMCDMVLLAPKVPFLWLFTTNFTDLT